MTREGLIPEKWAGSRVVAECPVCGDEHEWSLDQGAGAPFGRGWVECPEYGHVSVPVDEAHRVQESGD